MKRSEKFGGIGTIVFALEENVARAGVAQQFKDCVSIPLTALVAMVRDAFTFGRQRDLTMPLALNAGEGEARYGREPLGSEGEHPQGRA